MEPFGKTVTVRWMAGGLLAVLLGLFPSLVLAQPSAHYVPGVEGIKGASLPPPGLYFRDYNTYYTSDQLNDKNGDEIDGSDLSTSVYAQVPRVLWITDTKVCGGFLGVDALWPIVNQSVDVNTPGGNFDDSTLSLADPFVETTLSWHPKQFDFALGLGAWIPVGNYEAPPTTQAGLGYWGAMLTAGVTWYPDAEKKWAVSLLNRYEINAEQRETYITPGNAYTLEWGVSNSVTKTVDLGVVGYFQQQITEDDGDNASSTRDSVAAIGPEISMAFPEQSTFVSFRWCYEFMANARAQGQTFNLTLTHRF